MSRKVIPTSLRVGKLTPFLSTWYQPAKNFGATLHQDRKIRTYLHKILPSRLIAAVFIERSMNHINVIIRTSKQAALLTKYATPGSLGDALRKHIKIKNLHVQVEEIKRPELNALLVAKNIAQQVSARRSYKRAVKTALNDAMRAGAKGIKIIIGGRLNGAEIARKEKFIEGRVPLQTFRADIDYNTATAPTIYGKIGIKVYIFKGAVYGKRDVTLRVAGRPTRRVNK